MSDLRAAIEALPEPILQIGDGYIKGGLSRAAVLALIPEGAVLAQVLPDDTVCACLHETGERKVRRYDRCQRCGAFMVADEGAVLVTEETLARAFEHEYWTWIDAQRFAAAILRHLREGT